MKKSFLLLPILAFFSVVILTATAFAEFPDVGVDNKNYIAITYLNEKGIINGYKDGTFRPEKPVNRAEATKILTLSFNVTQSPDATAIFPDVNPSDWFYEYVMGAYENKIINGYEDGTFRPANQVNLAELLKIMLLSANVQLQTNITENVFIDVAADAWYAPHALYSRDNNLVVADINGQLNASTTMTRGEFSEVVYRMMISQETKKPFDLATNWTVFGSETIPFKIKTGEFWKIEDQGSNVKIYRPDPAFNIQSANRAYPNSASMQISVDNNDKNLNSDQYFNAVKGAFSHAEKNNYQISNLPALEVIDNENLTHDIYVFMNDGDVLTLYSQYGDGDISFFIKKELEAILDSFEFSPVANNKTDYSDVLSRIYEHLLIENKGMEMLNLLPEKTIIETDTIGVGTGPVDYYYCETVNITFKYERSGDLLLDKRTGKTSAF